MTKRYLSLAGCLPNGITDNFRTPCHGINFTKEVVTELINDKLPEMLSAMGAAWADIPLGYVSGLVPTHKGGPIDNCRINGTWSAERQAAHGGPIPFLSGACASRGLPEKWPYGSGSDVAPHFAGRPYGEHFNWAQLQFDLNRKTEC